MSGDPDSHDVRRQLVVVADQRADELRPCSTHDELEARPLKFSCDGEVYVTPQDHSLYYCPACVRDRADEASTRPVVTTEEAVPTVVLSLSAGRLRSFVDQFTNLGRGTVREGDVYLADNPPVDRIPDWLYDDAGVFLVDEDRVRAEEARADDVSSDISGPE